MYTIGEVISRVRNQVKSVKEDAFITDRFLYSLILKHASWLIRRQDSQSKLAKLKSIFQPINVLEIENVDKVGNNPYNLKSGFSIKRSVEPLPKMMEGKMGPMIRAVTSVDQSQELYPVHPSTYERMLKQSTFKYNSKKYYWYLDGYLYFPNIVWDAVRVEALFLEELETDDNKCLTKYERGLFIPEFLLAEVESYVKQDMSIMLQIPQDSRQDNNHIISQ